MEQIFIDIFKRHLLKEEKILWLGKPNNSRLFSKKDAYSIFVGTGFIGASLIWTVNGIMYMSGAKVENNIKPKQGMVFIVLGLLVTLLGIYQIIGKPIIRKNKKEKIFYAVTNKRLLIFEDGVNKKVISKYLSQINRVDIIKSNNKMGTIEFGENYPDSEFIDINDVENVYELINDLRSKIM
ncbi:hypothetical protein OD350_19230 [Clostridium beijerinckii]|uniref:hypothetical protein n=1 Tax=Clostridium TaxID=1485 RepID=UPI00156E9C2A|nr:MULTISPECIES: hypothetical protein [Clostridium]NRT37146.1 hypothetical protein [Clostridium beijerinckii]NRT43420.1 hypothetical protein [Clostridium beijerinckii]NRZ22589.1 hypothetical protein [Clostridium beijerinckii]UYZ34381.1 hypothetical protein OD350_19230 [Clostridium beijerinckii]